MPILFLEGVYMPKKLKKPCSFPGCPVLVEPGISYCENHKRKISSKRNKLYDEKQRDMKVSKFYNSTAWKKLRKIKLSKNPLCEYCLEKDRTRIATEVDHVIPIKIDWSRRLDLNNFKSTCHRCHMKKTQEDRRKHG